MDNLNESSQPSLSRASDNEPEPSVSDNKVTAQNMEGGRVPPIAVNDIQLDLALIKKPVSEKRALSKKSNKDLYKFKGLNNIEQFKAQMQVSSEAEDSVILEGRELGFENGEAVRTEDFKDKSENIAGDNSPNSGAGAGKNYFNKVRAANKVNFI